MASPQVFTDATAMRQFSRQQRAAGKTIGFVPTMGYLHEGHLSLVNIAKQRCDVVVVSIYVNPTQFAAHEDFDVYPRNEAGDRAKLAELGVEAVFEPRSLYAAAGASGEAGNVVGQESGDPASHETFVTVERLQRGLCGGSRPHFFRGVATVVTKLFHIVEPDVAVFGKKDYQQWRLIQRMVRDLDFAIDVVGAPIGRAKDRLALSSRNAMLSPEDRQRAPVIYQALTWARSAAASGEVSSAEELAAEVSRRIAEGGGKVDYVQVVGALDLIPATSLCPSPSSQPTLVAVAAVFGKVRLIDNIEIPGDLD